MTDALEDLRAAFRSALGARSAALYDAAREFRGGSAEAARSIRRLAHALRGVGGTYGYPEVSDAAAACEEAADAALLEALDRLQTVLRGVAAGEAAGTQFVLIVEDDDAISALLQAAVAAPGRRLFAVRTVLGAKMVLEDYVPDVILLDLVLPDADGRSLIGQLRSDPRTAAVPIMVLSSLTADFVRSECLALGADEFILKPLDPRAVATRVAGILARRVREGPAAGARPAPPPPAGARTAPLPSGTGGPAHVAGAPPAQILLAEDDELISSVIVHRLTREGLQVHRCADGAAAFAALQAGPYALVILDVKMPAMDGFELLARLRALPAHAATPVLMLTSMGSEKDIARGLDLGADDYVVKPFSPLELVARVNRHLTR